MESNRANHCQNLRSGAEIVLDFGPHDSIIDRLFSLPVPMSGAIDPVQAAVVRRLEKVLVDKMRGRLENGTN